MYEPWKKEKMETTDDPPFFSFLCHIDKYLCFKNRRGYLGENLVLVWTSKTQSVFPTPFFFFVLF